MTDVITIDELKSSQHWFRKINVGTRVSIQLLDRQQTRIQASLLGFRIGKYILARYDDNDSLPVTLTDYSAVVRFLVEDLVGECLAFKTEVIHCTRHPDRILFLAFPEEIHHRPLRNQQRAAAEIAASIRVNSSKSQEHYPGHIVDISSGGCRFLFGEEIKNSKVKELPVVVSIGDNLKVVDGEVRSSRMEGSRLSVGIKFNEAQNDLKDGPSGLISEMREKQS